ncbi:hypothetical protein E4U41_003284 [Claviceps citrina]|nr:hypothetical protein E4U41_003284 [Claviceps citrina]
MCTTEIYTYVYPDGRQETMSRPSLCPASRHNQPCFNNAYYRHAAVPVSYGHPVAPAMSGPSSYSAPYLGPFPPSPSYSPRMSAASYRSGDESDRSFRSSNSDRPPSSSSGFYASGQAMEPRRHARNRAERLSASDNSPTSRTPPHPYTFPSTAPSSPNFASTSPSVATHSSSRGSASRPPAAVDERAGHDRDRDRDQPRNIHIEIVDGHANKRHNRQSSGSSHGSRRHSLRSASEEEELRRRRLSGLEQQHAAERRRQAQQEEEIRQSELRAKIAKANAEIAKRPPVPMAPPPLNRSSTSAMAKAAQAAKEREQELLDAVRRLDLEERRRENRDRHAARREEEEEAQRHRLMQRMAPGPRATVEPSSRRNRVEYDDEVYRWA